MKKITWLALAPLLLFSCRKSEVSETRGKDAAPPVGKSQARLGIGNPGHAAATDADVNSRTRPLPRQEDLKHKPAPPVNEPHPLAVAVEGKPGFVVSPFNDKIIDVRDLPPGTLVADPSFPSEEKKYFRVP